MKNNRVRRTGPWILGAAILSGPIMAGCSDTSQSTGLKEDAPKESPVLSTKDSMQEFMKNRKAQQSPARKK